MQDTSADYPNEIDLGRKESDMGMPVSPSGKKGKTRTIYPKLYVQDAPADLKDLPMDGCVMVKYHREQLSVDTPSDGEDKTGLTLEIRSICLPEDAQDAGEPKDLASVMDGKMADDEESEDAPDDETDEGE